MYRVLKRDGSMMEFHIAKIGNAITKAFEAVGRQYHPSVIELLALRVTAEATAMGGASVQEYRFRFAGQEITGASGTTGVVGISGTLTPVVTVTTIIT